MPDRKAGSEESDTTNQFDWDGNPLNRYPWAKHLAKRAFKHDARFRQHVEQGYHMAGYRTITQSVEHSTNLYFRNVTRSTWDDPACVGHWQFSNGTSHHGAIPADETKDYTASLHDCEQIDRMLIDFILSTITDESEKQDMEDACKGDARTLLLNIKNYRPPPEVGTWALTKRQQISAAGIDSASATSFNHFRTWWTLYNEQCESPDPPQVAVSVYMAAVRKLGDSISGKLDYELLRTSAGPADIDKVISAIKTVLTRHAATELTGTALQMGARHDPRRNVNNLPKGAAETPPKVFVDGVDDDCALCKSNPLSIGGGAPGKHLRKHCKNFVPFAERKKGKKGSGKAAGGFGDDDDDNESDDGEDAALAFYATDGAATVDGAGVEVSVNEMLLGGRSGTVTLSDSLSRAARVGAANVAGSSAAPAPAPAPAPPVHSEMALFNLWLAEKQSAAAAAAAAATLDAVAAAAPAPAPAPAPVPAAR